MGGEVLCVPVSAKSGEGLKELLESIDLQADVMERMHGTKSHTKLLLFLIIFI